MNLPWVYMCSPSWAPLPPPSLYHPSGSSQCTSPKHPVSNLDWQFVSYMTLYMFQCHSPKSSHPHPLPQSPKDCSIHLCLFGCLLRHFLTQLHWWLSCLFLFPLWFFFMMCLTSDKATSISDRIWLDSPKLVHSPKGEDPEESVYSGLGGRSCTICTGDCLWTWDQNAHIN